ncbi:uncharacterized protein K02A2.6-like [Aedes albopictus]|uniref:RNA-directed DNA polymerase n=1 Tax=Aedes albopictus TaxID=7160 RepID=A0ABM1YRW2_AEDAL
MDDKDWPLQPFNEAVESSDLRREWEEWHRSFELILEMKRIECQHEKLVLLLARGGRGLQRIFYNLRPVAEEIYPEPVPVPLIPKETPEYDNAVLRLSKFFIGKRNVRIELELFRTLKQSESESFSQFLLRLRTQAARCEFQEREEIEILQQVTVGAFDERVRDKGLEGTFNLDAITNYAMNREMLLKQKEKAKTLKEEPAVVAAVKLERNARTAFRGKIRTRPFQSGPRPTGGECNRCGSYRHSNDDVRCPAKKARCNNCGKIGHFGRKCRGGSKRFGRRETWKQPKEEANVVTSEDDWNEELPRRPVLEDIQQVSSSPRNNGIITCLVNNFPVDFLIDSGAAINTITEEVWAELQRNNVDVVKRNAQGDRQFSSYASEKPLRVLATLESKISINPSKPITYAEFFVIQGANRSLLSKTTAEELNVLKVGLDVHQVEETVNPFPKFPNVQVKLSVDPSIPPKKVAYLRIPEPMKDKVDEKIQEMLRQDIIEPVRGPPDWISPLVIVPKGKGDVRLCVNMRFPNQAIQREHYPIPVIDTVLNELRGSTVFSRLDMTSAYYHLELHPDSRNVTTFMSNRGLMRFKRLMFGINCAPEIFQRVMTEMLAGIDGVVVYIDDVVVAGRTLDEHDMRLQKVLSVLESNNAKLNLEKCVFRVTELEILGFKVNALGIRPSEEKIAAIRNFRLPETKEEVRSFLGLVNFVGHFIPDLSTRTEPLRKFIRGEIVTFGENQKAAFDDLRNELTTKVRQLGFFDPKDTTELYVDGSPVGLGAVLIQRDKAQWPRIISFASKSLTNAERLYPQTQREALAVVWAVEKYYLYLFGLRFTVFTDHKTLEYIFEGKYRDGRRACSRAQGWALRLQPYDFQIKHIQGANNISDVLSRLCTTEDAPFDESSQHFLCAVGESPDAITLEEIRTETARDPTLTGVVEAMKTQNWPSDLFRFQAFSKELGLIDGIVVREDRIVLPLKLRRRALDIAHRGHPGIVAMRRNLRQYVWWPCMDKEVCSAVTECVGCTAVSGLNPPEPMSRKMMPERAWQEIAIDFLSAKEFATFLVVVDYYSRYLHVIEMKSTTATRTIEALMRIFKDHTFPESIRSDNGPPFSSEEFSQFCASKNIKLNQGILKALRISKALKTDWRKSLEDYVYMYNTTPHTVTEKPPLELLTGRPVKDLLPSLRTDPHWQRDETIRENDAMKKMQGKLYADHRRHAKESDISIGDIVMLKSYESGKLESTFKMEKFTVLERTGTDTVVVNKDGVKYRRPVAHLKKWPSPSLPSTTSDSSTGSHKTSEQDVLNHEPKDVELPQTSSPMNSLFNYIEDSTIEYIDTLINA